MVVLLAGGCAASQGPAPEEGRHAQLQDALDRWAAAPGHHGVSASVVFPDGTSWSGTAGEASPGERLREDHLVWIASITKTMTGAVILQLADESRLSLDDPVERWLAPIPNVDPRVTLRQLLNHTGGVSDYVDSPSFRAALEARPERVFTATELLAFAGPPRFAPGGATDYSNTGFLLLAEVAQEVTGRTLLAGLHERLWGPLGLDEMFLPGLESPPGPVAAAWGRTGAVAPLGRMSSVSAGNAAFGVFATARAVSRWGRALFEGQVVSPRMQKEMRRAVPAVGDIPGETGSGLGIRTYGYLGRLQLGHSGGASLGSSLLLHDPERRVTVTVLMNQGEGADHFSLGPLLLDLATRR
jgi:D-alanyl-D-alanine carboxypeptidase